MSDEGVRRKLRRGFIEVLALCAVLAVVGLLVALCLVGIDMAYNAVWGDC